jgi:hypothetical protein
VQRTIYDGDDGEISEDRNEDFISDDDEVEGAMGVERSEGTDDDDKGSFYQVSSDLDDLFD